MTDKPSGNCVAGSVCVCGGVGAGDQNSLADHYNTLIPLVSLEQRDANYSQCYIHFAISLVGSCKLFFYLQCSLMLV